MYQGKFEQDNPNPVEETAAPTEEVEFVRPVRRERKKKKPIRTRTLVFWTCVLSFVLIAVIAICIGLAILKDWLINFEYEATLPDTKSQAVFDQYFADPDWERIYELSNEPDTKFEGSKAYAAYMDQWVGDNELRLVNVPSGLSKDFKFKIYMDKTEIASFTLVSTTTDGKKDLLLGDVEIIYACKESCTVLTAPGATVQINGVALDDSYVIKTVTTNAPQYLPDGIRGYETVLYRVEGLMAAPTVTVIDANGQQIALDYDKDAKLYSHFIGSVAITDAESQALVDAAQVYCKYMIGKANKTTLQQYFDSNSDAYKTMTSIDKWMQSYKSYAFAPASITEYYRYSDTLYSARVEMTLNVTRKDDTIKEYPLHSTFILQQQDGKWKVINMLNLSIQQQTTSVLLNYYDASGKTLLLSEMADADSKSLTPPAIEVPEGKQLYWSNRVNMFPVDENGNITFPDDYTLEPMDFYAVLKNKEA